MISWRNDICFENNCTESIVNVDIMNTSMPWGPFEDMGDLLKAYHQDYAASIEDIYSHERKVYISYIFVIQ